MINLRNYVIFKIYQNNLTRNKIADSNIIFKPTKKAEALHDEYNYIILDIKVKTITYQMNQYKTGKNCGQKNIVEINKDWYPLFYNYKKSIDMFTDEN